MVLFWLNDFAADFSAGSPAEFQRRVSGGAFLWGFGGGLWRFDFVCGICGRLSGLAAGFRWRFPAGEFLTASLFLRRALAFLLADFAANFFVRWRFFGKFSVAGFWRRAFNVAVFVG